MAETLIPTKLNLKRVSITFDFIVNFVIELQRSEVSLPSLIIFWLAFVAVISLKLSSFVHSPLILTDL